MVEYALIVTLIAVASIAAIRLLSGKARNTFQCVSNGLP